MNKDAFTFGADAFYEGKVLTDNPYKVGTKYNEEWERGWKETDDKVWYEYLGSKAFGERIY